MHITSVMGGARLFLLGGQGAGHVGADISHGRALDGCMDDNWGGAAGGQGQGTRGSCPPLEPPMTSVDCIIHTRLIPREIELCSNS